MPEDTPPRDIGLPMIPWHGGPSYFNKFARAANWASPGFFPIGAYWRNARTQNDIDADKAAGINGYFCTYDDANLALIRKNGFWVTNPVRGFGSHVFTNEGAETIGRFLGDEPDAKLGPGSDGWSIGKVLDPRMGFCVPPFADPRHPQCGFTALTAYRAEVEPGMFAYWNGNRAMIALHGKDRAAEWIRGGWADWITADLEFYCDPTLRRPQTGGRLILGEHWHDGNFDGNTYSVPVAQARRASNYGRVVERLLYLCEVAGLRIPVGGYVETCRNWHSTEYAEVTPPEVQGALWSCIIFGAYGITLQDTRFFPKPDGSWGKTDFTLRHGAQMSAAVKETASQIAALAEVINSPRYDIKALVPRELDARLSLDAEGNGYLWLQQNHLTGHLGGGSYTVTLPDAFKTAPSVELVLQNDRSVPVIGGEFTADFAAEYGTHICRIAKAAN